MSDIKLLKWSLVILLIPLGLAFCSTDKFRYPCQNPENWDKAQCQKPLCDVTRTCPEHVFKGQRDPRLGMPTETSNTKNITQGVSCGK